MLLTESSNIEKVEIPKNDLIWSARGYKQADEWDKEDSSEPR